jgi:hypothetical protein
MAFKDLFIKEESAPPKQPVVAYMVLVRGISRILTLLGVLLANR